MEDLVGRSQVAMAGWALPAFACAWDPAGPRFSKCAPVRGWGRVRRRSCPPKFHPRLLLTKTTGLALPLLNIFWLGSFNHRIRGFGQDRRGFLMKAKLFLVLAVAGVGLGVSATCGVAAVTAARQAQATPAPCGAAIAPPVAYKHVVWIVMENKRYKRIIGSLDAPY